MNKQEILDAFIQAEKDWSTTVNQGSARTHWGLCLYFCEILNAPIEMVEMYLMPRWIKYRTITNRKSLHFYAFGDSSQGRLERIEAIRKVINDLKNELNENH
jgi:hypothetical protein